MKLRVKKALNGLIDLRYQIKYVEQCNCSAKFKKPVYKLEDVSLADILTNNGGSDLENAKEWLENRDVLELSEKQRMARTKLSQRLGYKVSFQTSVQVAKYGNDVITYVENSHDQGYKVGEWEGRKIVFHWENPEPIRSELIS